MRDDLDDLAELAELPPPPRPPLVWWIAGTRVFAAVLAVAMLFGCITFPWIFAVVNYVGPWCACALMATSLGVLLALRWSRLWCVAGVLGAATIVLGVLGR